MATPPRGRVRRPTNGQARRRAHDADLAERLARLESQLRELAGARVNVRREEHEDVVAALRKLTDHTTELARHTHDLEIQFQRIAQMQAELDQLKRAQSE